MSVEPPSNGRYRQSEVLEEECEWLHRGVLASVSHDLKTPLACIIGSLEIYERTKQKLSPDQQNTLLDTALNEAYRLDGFITNILDMARLESGTVKVKKESCMMDLLLEDCQILLDHRLRECDVNLKAIPEPFPVTTDPLLLMRAICIVFDNAAKYGGEHKEIKVEYERGEDQAVIRIADNGPGILEEKLEEIFSKYTRFDLRDYKHSGTGLGLPICRKLMRLLGGTVSVANIADGKGAVFTLTFAA